mgnify:CR=1 FL=1
MDCFGHARHCLIVRLATFVLIGWSTAFEAIWILWGWDMDRRFILQGLECQASIGIYDAERANKQRIKIDAEVRLYPATEPVDDKVDSTLNYDLIRETILNIVSARHYNLQETLARCLFARIIGQRLAPNRLRITVH